MKKQIDYNFSNLGKNIIIRLMEERGLTGDLMMLPFLGGGSNIKTINFQSKTSEKAIIRLSGRHYFIKKIPWYCAEEELLAFIYDQYNHLLQSGFPCPPVVRTREGGMVSQYNGSFYVFFEYIEGDEYAQSREQAYSVGAQLAALHNATLRTSADRFSESILDSFNDLAAISNLVDIEKVQKQAAENFHKIEDYGLYTCVVHGDCNPSNFIFDQAGHVKGIVDFDNVKVDNPIRDIAEAILAFGITRYRNNTSNFENIFNTPNRELCRAILKGYQEHTSDPEMFAKLLPSLTSAIKIIAAEFYVLAFLKKNTLSDPSYSVDGLDLSFLMSSS